MSRDWRLGPFEKLVCASAIAESVQGERRRALQGAHTSHRGGAPQASFEVLCDVGNATLSETDIQLFNSDE
jgi:hypothetical protein